MDSEQPDPEPTIGATMAELLHAELDPDATDLAAAARVKQRLLRRIAADNTPRHLTVQPDAQTWQPFGHGVELKVLHEASGVMSYLLRLAPGAHLPAHRHPMDEECVVLEGEVCIGNLRVAAGGFHLGRKDVLHDVLRSDTGALIFLRGAVPEVDLAV